MQIEKIKSPLDLEKGNYKGTEFDIIPADTFVMVCRKINSLVDAVNELQKHTDRLSCAILDLATPDGENKALKSIQVAPADPYAEQRKWIGTLCRCWDSDINDDIWGILQDIKDNKTEKYYLYGIGYEHCEPVKSDDDIIYKGDK